MHRAIFFLSLFTLLLPAGLVRAAAGREQTSLDQGWRFIKQDVNGAADTTFDDASWQQVDLPHTWNAEDATGGTNRYYRGVGWYRRHLPLTAAQTSKRLYLWFGAAGSAADVYVNGQLAGSHKGAFGAFCFDIGSFVAAGDNVVAVRVSNAADPNLAPLAGDFNVEGGLYRDARLLATETLHISPLDFASSGVYVKQSKVTDESAELEITSIVRNSEPADLDVSAKFTITDAAGNAVATETATQQFSGGQTMPIVQKFIINRPHLWNGRSDPYEYNVNVELSDSGNVTDSVTVPFGLRYFKVDPVKGFILNGKPYDLHGVNRHQDFGKKGWAITKTEMQTDMDLIKELGCTMVRLAHYEHSPMFYDLCDKNGLVVWAELCQVNLLGKTPEFAELSKQQLTELIKQNFNHPSICFWSLYNELNWAGGEQDVKLISEENDLAHELDPTRLTTAASNRRVEMPGHWVPDIIAFNVYYGWYADQVPPDWKSGLDRIVSYKPDRAVGISEYGAGGSIKVHEIPPQRPPTVSPHHPEEYQSLVHEQGWAEMSGRPLWCRLVWVFADFPAAPRREGDTIGMNDKGLITADRKVKKDAFYFYKAQWSDEPFVYITSRRFTPRPLPTTQVKIYSNCDKIELTVNGQSLGSKAGDREHIFVWDDVKLQAGDNQFSASGTSKDGKPVSDACTIVQATPQTFNP